MNEESPPVRQIRLQYQQSLRDKSAALGAFEQHLAETPLDSQRTSATLIELGEYLHKLAGSAGMYGYPELARLARGGMSDAAQGRVESLSTCLAELRNLLEQQSGR